MCGYYQENTKPPRGPCWEIIKGRKGKKNMTLLLYWHSFGVALYKELLLATAYPWQRGPACRNLCLGLRNANVFRRIAHDSSWSLRSAVCSPLRTPAVSSASQSESLPRAAPGPGPQRPSGWPFATQPGAERYLASNALQMDLRACFLLHLPVKVNRRICSQPFVLESQHQTLQHYVCWEHLLINFCSWLSLITPGLPWKYFAFSSTFYVPFIYHLFTISIKAEETQPWQLTACIISPREFL